MVGEISDDQIQVNNFHFNLLLNPESDILIPNTSQRATVERSDFEYHHLVGKGGYGAVWKVEMLQNQQIYAIKEISKAKVIAKRAIKQVMN